MSVRNHKSVLDYKEGERIVVGNGLTVRVVEVQNNRIKLSADAPPRCDRAIRSHHQGGPGDVRARGSRAERLRKLLGLAGSWRRPIVATASQPHYHGSR